MNHSMIADDMAVFARVVELNGFTAAARKLQAQSLHHPAAHPQPVHEDYGFAHSFPLDSVPAPSSRRKPASAGSRQNAR